MRRLSNPMKFSILLLGFAMIFASAPSIASAQLSIGISVGFGPPAIPVYTQPPCPDPNYIWSPGYWAYGDGGYYWVPGTWVPVPAVGLLWTPGYWGWNGHGFGWNNGYWATQVGFYGGVNYGYGYYGHGYYGGRWYGDRFLYNTAITSVSRTIYNVYNDPAERVSQWNRVGRAG